jgi:hypothetical protein
MGMAVMGRAESWHFMVRFKNAMLTLKCEEYQVSSIKTTKIAQTQKAPGTAKGAGRAYGGNDGLAFRVMDFRAKPKIQREKR